MPPDIDPCAGSGDSCYTNEVAEGVQRDARMLAFVSTLNPACRAALSEAKADKAGLERAYANWPALQSAAGAHEGDPSLLAAVGVRETDFENIAEYNGGNGRGYFQIDIGKNPGVSESEAFSIGFASNFAATMLTTNLYILQAKHPNLNPGQLLQATAASYNAGVGNTSGNPKTIDIGTTGNNYGSNTVTIRNACF